MNVFPPVAPPARREDRDLGDGAERPPIAGAPAYDLFNLSSSVAVRKDVSFRFGVDNLFNKAPPLFGVNTAPHGRRACRRFVQRRLL